MEKVDTVGSVCAEATPLVTKTKMDNRKYFFIDLSHLSRCGKTTLLRQL
jgi:hypothetical protein